MKRLLAVFALLTALLGLGTLAAVPAYAAWNPFDDPQNSESVCRQDRSKDLAVCDISGKDPISGPGGVLIRVTRLIAYVTGAIAVIMMIVGGFMYITSNGDTGKISTAKNTLIYAAVGLVVIATAQMLIVFVINRIAP